MRGLIVLLLVTLHAIGVSAASPMPDVRAMPYQYFINTIDECPAVTLFRYEDQKTLGVSGPAALAWYKAGSDRRNSPFAVITTVQLNGTDDLMFIDFDRDGIADEEGPVDGLADKYDDDICILAEKVN